MTLRPDVLVRPGFGNACPMTPDVKAFHKAWVTRPVAAPWGMLSPQRFLVCSNASVCEIWAALVRFVARFSFSDLPDFLVIVCRGDLSDIGAL